jgi:hypothetical protein
MSEDFHALLRAARVAPRVSLERPGWPWERGPSVLREVRIGPIDPKAIARRTQVEILVLDVLDLSPAAVAAIAGLPELRVLEVGSGRHALAAAPAGFPRLACLSLPFLEGGLDRYAAFLQSLPALTALHLPEAALAELPDLVASLPGLRELDLTGVPVPEPDLEALQRARPDLVIRTSPVNLGWAPGIAGVLRIPDGFDVPEVPLEDDWEIGFRLGLAQRQATFVHRWRDSPVQTPDFCEAVHGPVDVETFVRRGPPIPLDPSERRALRRLLEQRLGLPTWSTLSSPFVLPRPRVRPSPRHGSPRG